MSMANQVQSGLATGSEGLVCFVCDVGVVGRYYALATCRTQTTKVRLIEKLGQLVGEDYMVVISEDDVICRGCATMINSLDRLEKEVGSLRSIVLRYLEKKYDMEDGELVNSRPNPQCQTKSSIKDSKSATSPTDFQSRKRKAMSSEVDSEELARENSGKDSIWLQCDRCKYTTQYNAFMVHHVRTHNKEKGGEGGGGGGVEGGVVAPVQQVTEVEKQNGEEKAPPSVAATTAVAAAEVVQQAEPEQITPDLEPVEIKKDLSSMSESSETVEMIAAEIGHEYDGEGGTPTQMLQMAVASDGGGKQVTLQAVEGEDGANTICMVDENGVIVQKVEQAEDGTLYVQMADNTDPTKQVLSVGEDGSVQMVEVLWDDMVNADEGEAHSMVTF